MTAPNPATAGPSAPTDSLSFLDLFYAVPVGDLAVRVSTAHLGSITAADWSTVAVEISALLLSWLGLHQNRADMARRAGVPRRWWVTDIRFASIRFAQFSLEVAITGLYFVIGLTLQLPKSAGTAPLPRAQWVVGTVALTYAAYIVWDAMDVYNAHKFGDRDWRWQAFVGGIVSLVWLVGLAVCFLVEHVRNDAGVTALNLSLIAALYIYRVTQQLVKELAQRHRRSALSQ